MKWMTVGFKDKNISESCINDLKETNCRVDKDCYSETSLYTVYYMPIGRESYNRASEIVNRYIIKDMGCEQYKV